MRRPTRSCSRALVGAKWSVMQVAMLLKTSVLSAARRRRVEREAISASERLVEVREGVALACFGDGAFGFGAVGDGGGDLLGGRGVALVDARGV
jgi:hypothetical protein